MKKALSSLIILIILAAIVALVWLAVVPEKSDSFTEFYILGLDGKATGYPKTLNVGDAGAVIVGIVNKEHVDVTYQLSVKQGDIVINRTGPITLVNEQKWEQWVSFTPTQVGDHQKIEFLLYKDTAVDPSLSLNLWIDVK